MRAAISDSALEPDLFTVEAAALAAARRMHADAARRAITDCPRDG